MKARLVKTSFWTDPEIESLSPTAKCLFLYTITNPCIGLTGAYKLSGARVSLETGYPINTVSIGYRELEKAGFLIFKQGWMIVFNTDKHNGYSSSPMTKTAYDKEYLDLPEWVKDTLSGRYTYHSHTHRRRNKKLEIRNKKPNNKVILSKGLGRTLDKSIAYKRLKETVELLRPPVILN